MDWFDTFLLVFSSHFTLRDLDCWTNDLGIDNQAQNNVST